MQITADDLLNPGYDIESGYGRLNAFQAVSYGVSTPEIILDVDLLTFELEPGAADGETVLIINTGEDDLEYSIDPDAYFWTDSNDEYIDYEWIDIESMGTQLTFTHNDEAAAETIDLDFSFPFYDQNYSSCIVNANGWIGFGDDSNEWDNIIIPDPTAPRPAVFGYWDDLNPNNTGNSNLMSGDVYYHSDSHRLVVWFDHVVHWYGSNSIEGTYDFQMVLYADGAIRFNYRTMEGEIGLGTIGIQNAAGDNGVLVSYNQEYAVDNTSVWIQRPHDWLTIDPLSATIEPEDAVELTVSVDAVGVSAGLYHDWIVFTTNDYANVHPIIQVITDVGGTDCSGWNLGDMNQDNILNILDIIQIVNIVLDVVEDPDPCVLWAADSNSDTVIDILDVILLLNIVLEG